MSDLVSLLQITVKDTIYEHGFASKISYDPRNRLLTMRITRGNPKAVCHHKLYQYAEIHWPELEIALNCRRPEHVYNLFNERLANTIVGLDEMADESCDICNPKLIEADAPLLIAGPKD